ncbi:MAG: hypothetical protein JWM99_3924, partial [Verrucomicrobiales bacterium]|nr:hypothetical protein [Verrucomicrobiales bacterium]
MLPIASERWAPPVSPLAVLLKNGRLDHFLKASVQHVANRIARPVNVFEGG